MIQTLRRLQQILDTNAFLLTRDQIEEARKLVKDLIGKAGGCSDKHSDPGEDKEHAAKPD